MRSDRSEALMGDGRGDRGNDAKKRTVWTIVTMVMTFLIYASYHMTRKIPSVVTDVINPINSNKESVYGMPSSNASGSCNNTGWEPFNDDLNPLYINQASVGLDVSNFTFQGDKINGRFLAASDIMWAPYTASSKSSGDSPVIVYCRSAHIAATCNMTRGESVDGWMISSNATGNPCAADSIYFASNTSSPVPNAVGGNGWKSCTTAGLGDHSGAPVIAPHGVSSGTEEWGDMITMYLGFYALGLFVSGHVADRMNKKLFVMLGMGGSAATVALVGLSYYFNVKTSGYYWFIFAIQGLFQATGWPAVVAITGPWLGKGKRGLLMGIWNAHTSVGNIMGNYIGAAGLSVVTSNFTCKNNWPMAFILAGAAMTGINFLTLFVLKSHPSSVGLDELSHNSDEDLDELAAPIDDRLNDEPPKKKRSTFVRALCVPGLIEFAVCLFFCKLVAYTFIYWGPTYVQHGGLDAVKATKYSSFLDYGGIIGGIGAGFLADRIKSQAWVAFGCLVCGVVALYVFRVTTANISDDQLTEYALLMMMVGMFINAPYALITTAVSADLGTTTQGDADLMATVTGIIDGTGSVGAAIQGALIGWVSQQYGWNMVFYLLMIFLAISALCLVRLIVRDSKRLCCKNNKTLEGE